MESAVTQVVREAGARVRTNQFLRDLNIAGIRPTDGRRIEIVADGLTLYHGAQLVIDTTLISALRGDSVPHPRCATEDGVSLVHADKKKRDTYPEFGRSGSRAKLIVFCVEVGGRWSEEASNFLTALA